MIMMQEVGRLFFNDEDATQLRKYLLKGGFLWVDDFWGSYAWNTWAAQIAKVSARRVPDRRLGGGPSDLPHDVRFESDPADSGHRVLTRQRRRDLGARRRQRPGARAWNDPRYFYRFSVEGYQVAMNVLIYVMTH